MLICLKRKNNFANKLKKIKIKKLFKPILYVNNNVNNILIG